MKLVEIRGGAPLLNDIPGQLEQLAKDIRGSKVRPQLMVVLMRDEAGQLDISGYGEAITEDERAGLLLRGAHHCAHLADMDGDLAEPEPAA